MQYVQGIQPNVPTRTIFINVYVNSFSVFHTEATVSIGPKNVLKKITGVISGLRLNWP